MTLFSRAAVAMAVLAAGLLGVPATIVAQTQPPSPIDMIATLNAICVTAQNDPAQVAILATEAGFSPVPDDVVPNIRNTSGTAGFMRSNATDISFVMTGRMTRRVARETVVIEVCGVTARPVDHRALNDRLRQVMGFAPVRGAGFDAYAWLQTSEGRAPSRSLTDAQFVSMAGTGQMRMVGLDRSGRGSTLMYFLPGLD